VAGTYYYILDGNWYRDHAGGRWKETTMARPRSLEDKLAKLRLLRNEPATPALVKELRDCLADTSNFVVAEAAALAGKARLADLERDLVVAFDRFLNDPVKRDKQCQAKIAIAEAMNECESMEESFFWKGARYVQPEPVWGGTQDTAVPVRVACAFGLVRTRARGVQPYLVDLLCDQEKPARMGAAQALAYSGTEAAYLLLRLKARLGDKEPEVLSECFNGIAALNPEEGVSFIAEFVQSSNPAVQESAVLALGDSRRKEAFEILRKVWAKSAGGSLQEIVLMALSLLRLPPATDLLLSLVADDSAEVAKAALSALALHRYDERLKDRVTAVVAQTGKRELQAHFEERFQIKE
jgi:HEAT repeat protein